MLTKGELEYIRPWVSIRLTAVMGGYNPTVIDAALDCIAMSLNRQSTTGTVHVSVLGGGVRDLEPGEEGEGVGAWGGML